MKKLRVWDARALNEVYVLLQQIQNGIETIAKNINAQSLADLPDSMVPTHNLYEITLAYELLYNKVLECDLLSTGNLKQSSTIH